MFANVLLIYRISEKLFLQRLVVASEYPSMVWARIEENDNDDRGAWKKGQKTDLEVGTTIC